MTTGEKIYYRRKHLKMTQAELGRICGVSKPTVSKWENGQIENIRADTIKLIAKALQVTPEYLVGWEDDMGAYPSVQLREKIMPLVEADLNNDFSHDEQKALVRDMILTAYHKIYAAELQAGLIFAVEMKDDAMINARIFKGDLLFGTRRETPKNGDLVFALIDGDIQPRRVFFYNDRTELRPENPLYPVINYEGKEQLGKIYGKCLSVFGELK